MKKKRFLLFLAVLIITVATLTSGPETFVESGGDPEVMFSLDAGVNITGRTITLSAPAGCAVYYTTDGSDPAAGSARRYRRPLSLKPQRSTLAAKSDKICVDAFQIYDTEELPHAVCVKAVAVSQTGRVSPVAARTYFFQNIESVAVLSVSTDYANLLDYRKGIMVKGKIYDDWMKTPEARKVIVQNTPWYYEANYMQKGRNWERPATVEIFDGGNYRIENCGIRIRGGVSRIFPQKSFNIYFRDEYGEKELRYTLFPDAVSSDGSVISNYKSFMLRNGGNDTEYLKYHDTLLQHLLKGLDFSVQESRPAVLYLNGEYMGIYVLQEKYSDRFLSEHYGVNADNVIMIDEGIVEEGSDEDIGLYRDLMSYAGKDLADPEVYREFCGIADIGSMIDYYAAEIYISNANWDQENNVCLWRVRIPENDGYGDGRWRWMLYDTEYSSSLYGRQVTAYDYDSFTAALSAHPLFAAAMKNEDFRTAFIGKIEYLAENCFREDRVIEALDLYDSLYSPYMPLYYRRFGDTSYAWRENFIGIETFFANRAEYLREYAASYRP